jgi:hypothetical protein
MNITISHWGVFFGFYAAEDCSWNPIANPDATDWDWPVL